MKKRKEKKTKEKKRKEKRREEKRRKEKQSKDRKEKKRKEKKRKRKKNSTFWHQFNEKPTRLHELVCAVWQVGDVLYMPRGTVHQAVAQKDASTHLTISTYQNHSVGTLAQAVLHSAMQGQEEPLCLPLSLRRGLPPGFLYSHGYQVSFQICLQ